LRGAGATILDLRDGGVTAGAVQPTIASVVPDRVVDLLAKAAIALPTDAHPLQRMKSKRKAKASIGGTNSNRDSFHISFVPRLVLGVFIQTEQLCI
jgi:hypothetical protein